ncbi:MAG: hypothetical protein ACRCV4_10440 [Hafnia alvei]
MNHEFTIKLIPADLPPSADDFSDEYLIVKNDGDYEVVRAHFNVRKEFLYFTHCRHGQCMDFKPGDYIFWANLPDAPSIK